MIYVGPALFFVFDSELASSKNEYFADIKLGFVTLVSIIRFDVEKPEKGITTCSMEILITGVLGEPATIGAMSQAMNFLTVNQKIAGEVVCQAFLNGFLG